MVFTKYLQSFSRRQHVLVQVELLNNKFVDKECVKKQFNFFQVQKTSKLSSLFL